jgi:hypothetical protein
VNRFALHAFCTASAVLFAYFESLTTVEQSSFCEEK